MSFKNFVATKKYPIFQALEKKYIEEFEFKSLCENYSNIFWRVSISNGNFRIFRNLIKKSDRKCIYDVKVYREMHSHRFYKYVYIQPIKNRLPKIPSMQKRIWHLLDGSFQPTYAATFKM